MELIIEYTVKPIKKRVTRTEFETFLKTYPRKLVRDVYAVCDPPAITYNDFEISKQWPESVAARTFLYSERPGDVFYTAENDRVYEVMINHNEVLAGKRAKIRNPY